MSRGVAGIELSIGRVNDQPHSGWLEFYRQRR
jgi:hypothetical protein